MHTDCCSGKCLTYGSRCGYPAHRLKETYLSASEFQSIKKQRAHSNNDEVKVIGLPSESEPSNVFFKIDSAAKCHNVGEPVSLPPYQFEKLSPPIFRMYLFFSAPGVKNAVI